MVEWTWCHCRVRLGRVTTNFGGVDVVPFAEWMCHCRVPLQCALVGGEGDDQLWRSGRGAIAGCRCSVLWLGGGDDQLGGSGRGAFDNTKIGFCYLCWYNFFAIKRRFFPQIGPTLLGYPLKQNPEVRVNFFGDSGLPRLGDASAKKVTKSLEFFFG